VTNEDTVLGSSRHVVSKNPSDELANIRKDLLHGASIEQHERYYASIPVYAAVIIISGGQLTKKLVTKLNFNNENF